MNLPGRVILTVKAMLLMLLGAIVGSFIPNSGLLGKNIDQASFLYGKLAYPFPKVSQLQKDGFYIQHNSEELFHHHPTLKQNTKSSVNDVYFVAIVAGCTAAAIFGVIASGLCFYRFKKNNKAASDVEYPAYGVIGPGNKEKSSPNDDDDKLAHSAQMYHYQHRKQQITAVEKVNSRRLTSSSDVESEEENETDYTVYECPGLALVCF
ncbi:neural proliferation differentiation and control protein 1-like isoform X2 [Tachypleus tridentatus]|uniref:neural proliferation differentiation and control protein 1-like isoform X2 n=1 Tax=Tachypleus tridentatus TaxID=6853 RepID=UPI003FD61E9C